jgi:hypothetical protein
MAVRKVAAAFIAGMVLVALLPTAGAVLPARAAARCLLPPILRAGATFVESLGGTSEEEASIRATVDAVRTDGRTRVFTGSAGSEPDGQGWLEVRFTRADVGSWRYTYTTSQGADVLSRCTDRVRVVDGTAAAPNTATVGSSSARTVPPEPALPAALAAMGVLGLLALTGRGARPRRSFRRPARLGLPPQPRSR